jgi:hypothetical protein
MLADNILLVHPLNRALRAHGGGVELLAISMLASEGPLPFDFIVECIAKELYRRELKHAWLLDIGLFGSQLFVPSVAKAIEVGHGILWRIERGRLEEC